MPTLPASRARLASILVLSVAAMLAFTRPASAAGCPSSPVTEQGGQHWCYKHNDRNGDVHLWKSPNYDPATAITVIYVHGLDLPTINNGPDTCRLKRPYVDCIWDASDHDLVGQFAASGVNALFVAVEGGPEKYPLWSSLGSLLTSISDKGKIAPPSNVTVVAHSAGMYTAKGLWADAHVKHLVTLDWLKGKETPPLYEGVAAWYTASRDHKLTIVSGSTGQTVYGTKLAADLSCPTVDGAPASLTETQRDAACLHLKVGGGHMGPVFGHRAIPLALSRSGTAAPTSPATQGGGGGTPAAAPVQKDGPIGAPVLEIPIPNVSFTDAIRQNGQVTIPWLAQYIGGVYTFLLSIAGMLAAVMMVVGGFQYVTAGGDKGKLGAGKKRIVNALTGLILALGSYTILYAINPDLLQFNGLQVADVRTELLTFAEIDSADVLPPSTESSGSAISPSGPLPSALCSDVKTCTEKYCAPGPSSWPASVPGIMDPSLAKQIPDDQKTYPGISGNGFTASQQVIDLLIRAGAAAVAEDPQYVIEVGDAYRPLVRQFKLACPHILQNDGHAGGLVAWPGGSLHGAGFAVDLHLYKGKTELTQKNNTPKDISVQLDKIMEKAGFRRYTAELWHYEPKDAPYVNACRCIYPNCPWPPPSPSNCAQGGGFGK